MWVLGLMLLETLLVRDIFDIEGAIHMSASDKIYWVNTGTYISGTDTMTTIDADDTLSVNADTSMTFTSPTSSFSGHLDVGSGLDVTGNMTFWIS